MQNDEQLIVVVDDDERVCRAVERVLLCDGYRVRTFTSARAFLEHQDSMEPACMLIDVKMPDVDGLTMLLESRTAGVDAPAVFITGSADVDAIVRAMKAGASDLLEKPLDEEILLTAIRNATRVGDETRSARWQLGWLWGLLETLTSREAQVCALVTSGRLNKQIAMLIGTTEKTVKVHRARVMSKLRVRSVAELVRAVDHALAIGNPSSLLSANHSHLREPHALQIMRETLAAVAREETTGLRRPTTAAVAGYQQADLNT
jgi:FixJ family two-component response regulator